MFCKNCGKEIADSSQFCIYCGTNLSATQQQPVFEPAVQPTFEQVSQPVCAPVEPTPAPVSPKNPKKSRAPMIIAVISIIVVLASIATVIFFFSKKQKQKEEAKALSEGYISEVEDYLDFIKTKNTNVYDYISDAYLGGSFGSYFSGSKADDMHKLLFREMFEEEIMEYADVDYDNWKDFLKQEGVDEFFDTMNSRYGKGWKFDYSIEDSYEMSDSKVEDLNNDFVYIIENYEDVDYPDLKKKSRDFVNYLEDLNVKSAYEVEVDITIKGSKDSFEQTVTFVVAQIDKQWVIFEGPSHWAFIDEYEE